MTHGGSRAWVGFGGPDFKGFGHGCPDNGDHGCGGIDGIFRAPSWSWARRSRRRRRRDTVDDDKAASGVWGEDIKR